MSKEAGIIDYICRSASHELEVIRTSPLIQERQTHTTQLFRTAKRGFACMDKTDGNTYSWNRSIARRQSETEAQMYEIARQKQADSRRTLGEKDELRSKSKSTEKTREK
ncbi:hypothetical protein MGYG_06774 [Nannizzia gypsea CBS 118893]|uniref:Uncharacterized protein n=1 Tax=Arthroderma gypseum (strain ATCC MYA-4604 / CBS 118893) TaxID=535722 RepID=E4V159_ARTGP|nr:hypothetical protein MGYG_06774 [Nannizzia gypsea CBS 118893]EFR03774.1 hypothetical protein MGYG_06774 [Nannizzia gypsea CBS 118893]